MSTTTIPIIAALADVIYQGVTAAYVKKEVVLDISPMCGILICGLVASTAQCKSCTFFVACISGCISWAIFRVISKLLLAMHVDDPVDAVASHFGGAVVSILMVPFVTVKEKFFVQTVGLIVIVGCTLLSNLLTLSFCTYALEIGLVPPIEKTHTSATLGEEMIQCRVLSEPCYVPTLNPIKTSLDRIGACAILKWVPAVNRPVMILQAKDCMCYDLSSMKYVQESMAYAFPLSSGLIGCVFTSRKPAACDWNDPLFARSELASKNDISHIIAVPIISSNLIKCIGISETHISSVIEFPIKKIKEQLTENELYLYGVYYIHRHSAIFVLNADLCVIKINQDTGKKYEYAMGMSIHNILDLSFDIHTQIDTDLVLYDCGVYNIKQHTAGVAITKQVKNDMLRIHEEHGAKKYMVFISTI